MEAAKTNARDRATVGSITLHANLKNLSEKGTHLELYPGPRSTARESLPQRVPHTDEKCEGEERAVCEAVHEASS